MWKRIAFWCFVAILLASLALIPLSMEFDLSSLLPESNTDNYNTADSGPEPPTDTTTYLYSDNFEGAISSFWVKIVPDTPYAVAISAQQASTGTSSLRIELHKDDPSVIDGKSAEIRVPVAEGPAEEHIYSCAIYLPDGGNEDYAVDPNGSEVIVRWQNTPDPGEGWTYPPLALHTYEDHYEIWRVWDDAPITTDEQIFEKGNFIRYDVGSFIGDKGRWVKWVFKIKWGWLDSQNPRTQVYKDGVQVLDVVGPNTMNDQQGVVMDLGLHKWDWTQGEYNTSILTSRVIYYDDFSIQ